MYVYIDENGFFINTKERDNISWEDHLSKATIYTRGNHIEELSMMDKNIDMSLEFDKIVAVLEVEIISSVAIVGTYGGVEKL